MFGNGGGELLLQDRRVPVEFRRAVVRCTFGDAKPSVPGMAAVPQGDLIFVGDSAHGVDELWLASISVGHKSVCLHWWPGRR